MTRTDGVYTWISKHHPACCCSGSQVSKTEVLACWPSIQGPKHSTNHGTCCCCQKASEAAHCKWKWSIQHGTQLHRIVCQEGHIIPRHTGIRLQHQWWRGRRVIQKQKITVLQRIKKQKNIFNYLTINYLTKTIPQILMYFGEHPLSKKENQLSWWKMNAARTGKAGKDLAVYSGHIHTIRTSVFSSRKHCFKVQGKPQFRACWHAYLSSLQSHAPLKPCTNTRQERDI